MDDPVPLLPLEEWGYHMHAGEIYISKSGLPPVREDLVRCEGDEDPECIAGGATQSVTPEEEIEIREIEGKLNARGWLEVPKRYKLWQLFFAHRDYFWRLGLCVPGGDPWDWSREKYATGETINEI